MSEFRWFSVNTLNYAAYLHKQSHEDNTDKEEEEELYKPSSPVQPIGKTHHLHALLQTGLLLSHKLLQNNGKIAAIIERPLLKLVKSIYN